MVSVQLEWESIEVWIEFLDGTHYCQSLSLNCGIVPFSFLQLLAPVGNYTFLAILHLAQDTADSMS